MRAVVLSLRGAAGVILLFPGPGDGVVGRGSEHRGTALRLGRGGMIADHLSCAGAGPVVALESLRDHFGGSPPRRPQ